MLIMSLKKFKEKGLC